MRDFPLPIPFPTRPRRFRTFSLAASLLIVVIILDGCSHFRPTPTAEYVYVTVKQMYLRDRVAVVANRVAEVKNGERLKVLQQIPRFMEVKTPQGAVGWIEDHSVIDQSEFDDFQNLAKQHAGQIPVATAILYNELYMHLAPGRETQHFFLLPVNAKVSLLERASVPRNGAHSALGLPVATQKQAVAARPGKGHTASFEAKFLPAVPMEDWWLVRDEAGQTGWMLSRDLDVDVPDAVAQYAEKERMIGAYVLRTVTDPDSGRPNGQVPEYLTVLTPYKQGLPYDFDQVRVFTWDIRRHRYGTSFRLRDVLGFFPVTVIPGNNSGANGPEPTFRFEVGEKANVSLGPVTGRPHARQLRMVTYRLEGNLVRQVLPVGEKHAPPATHRTRDHASHRQNRTLHRNVHHRHRRH